MGIEFLEFFLVGLVFWARDKCIQRLRLWLVLFNYPDRQIDSCFRLVNPISSSFVFAGNPVGLITFSFCGEDFRDTVRRTTFKAFPSRTQINDICSSPLVVKWTSHFFHLSFNQKCCVDAQVKNVETSVRKTKVPIKRMRFYMFFLFAFIDTRPHSSRVCLFIWRMLCVQALNDDLTHGLRPTASLGIILVLLTASSSYDLLDWINKSYVINKIFLLQHNYEC